MQRSAERTSSWGSRTAIIARQNQHVSRDPHLSEPCDAQREPKETKGTERKKHHEEERVSERKVSVSDDRREDQGAGRLAGQDALPAPHIDQASRLRGGRGVEVERGSGVVSRRIDLHRRDVQERREDDLLQGGRT